MSLDALAILKELISIPSVNPMGRDVTGPEFFEDRLSKHLLQFFEQLGVEHQRIEVVPGRANIIARTPRVEGKTTVLLDAHQDTVPVDGMTIDPFEPKEIEGRLYGRGACDVKGGMAAMLAAFARLVNEKPAGAANVVISCTCDEESTSIGINDLTRLWNDADRAGSLLESPPDIAVVAEPTDLDIVVAHRGATRWKIRTRGRACHSSVPSDGVNAIYRMARIVSCLEEFAGTLDELVPPHPLCGGATLSVGRIEGGISVNTVPDECSIEIDRRVVPGEEPIDAFHQVENWLRQRIEFDYEMLEPWLVGATLNDDRNGEWADRLMEQIVPIAGPHQKVGVAYGTHASRIDDGGVPAMVFGPGSIEQAHTKDEWISIEELEQAAEVYYQFCGSVG